MTKKRKSFSKRLNESIKSLNEALIEQNTKKINSALKSLLILKKHQKDSFAKKLLEETIKPLLENGKYHEFDLVMNSIFSDDVKLMHYYNKLMLKKEFLEKVISEEKCIPPEIQRSLFKMKEQNKTLFTKKIVHNIIKPLLKGEKYYEFNLLINSIFADDLESIATYGSNILTNILLRKALTKELDLTEDLLSSFKILILNLPIETQLKVNNLLDCCLLALDLKDEFLETRNQKTPTNPEHIEIDQLPYNDDYIKWMFNHEELYCPIEMLNHPVVIEATKAATIYDLEW